MWWTCIFAKINIAPAKTKLVDLSIIIGEERYLFIDAVARRLETPRTRLLTFLTIS